MFLPWENGWTLLPVTEIENFEDGSCGKSRGPFWNVKFKMQNYWIKYFEAALPFSLGPIEFLSKIFKATKQKEILLVIYFVSVIESLLKATSRLEVLDTIILKGNICLQSPNIFLFSSKH